MTMRRGGDAIEPITVEQHLRDAGELSQVGAPYLSDLANKTPSAANLTYYLDIVAEKYELRKIVARCTDVVNRVYSFEGPAEQLIDEVERDLGTLFLERAGVGRFLTIDDLDSFDVKKDSNSLIGNRWLCRGGKLLIPAASGAGKSSLAMQMLVLFALGKDFCGIKPARPLSSIIVGDENDEGDMAEMFQGTRDFLGLTSFENDAEYSMLRKNMSFWDCPALTGDKFIAALENRLLKSPRDICCLDPLVSFAGCDLTRQDAAAHFLREGLSRISARTGVIFFVIHHTPKPKEQSGIKAVKKISDYQYSGAGTFDLPGWARAVMTLEESTDGYYRLILSKRGDRAGATHPETDTAITSTKVLWLRHATNGIHWEHVDPPIEAEETRQVKEKPLTIPMQIATLNLGTFLSKCPSNGEGLRAIARRLTSWLGSRDCPKRSLSSSAEGTIRKAIGVMLDNDKLTMNDGLYFKGSQA